MLQHEKSNVEVNLCRPMRHNLYRFAFRQLSWQLFRGMTLVMRGHARHSGDNRRSHEYLSCRFPRTQM